MSKGNFDSGAAGSSAFEDRVSEASDDRESQTGEFFSEISAPTQDQLAKNEAAAMASNEDLEADGKKKEHGRHQKFQDHANKVAMGLLWTVAFFTLLGICVYVFHLLAPERWKWLSPDALGDVRALLTGVLFSSAMTGYVNKRMT